MDILFVRSKEGASKICPASVHGMLWLQTHFEDEHWESLAASQVTLSSIDTEELSIDASKAGLKLDFIPTVSVSSNF